MNDVSRELAAVVDRLDKIEQRLKANAETTQRVSDRATRRLYAQFEALLGLYRSLDGQLSLPPMRHWAISPDSARVLTSLTIDLAPGHVVECGSGTSSVLFGHLAHAGHIGRITALEHDPAWFEATLQKLHEHGVDDVVELLFCPLVEQQVGDTTMLWYDIASVALDSIDLVFVDGPPQSTGEHARYPAVPLLLPSCNRGCVFMVDDYSREDDRETVRRWLDLDGIELRVHDEGPEKWFAAVGYSPDEAGDRQ